MKLMQGHPESCRDTSLCLTFSMRLLYYVPSGYGRLSCCLCLQAYFRQACQAISTQGGILVLDLLGGHAAEQSVLMHRHNDTTGARFVWEQEGFNTVTRHIQCYITLKDPDTRKVLHRL